MNNQNRITPNHLADEFLSILLQRHSSRASPIAIYFPNVYHMPYYGPLGAGAHEVNLDKLNGGFANEKVDNVSHINSCAGLESSTPRAAVLAVSSSTISFTELAGTNLLGMIGGAHASRDYSGDGFMDLVMAGDDTSGAASCYLGVMEPVVLLLMPLWYSAHWWR